MLDGINMVYFKLFYLVGGNWWNLQDENDDYVIWNLIQVVCNGGGFYFYVWYKLLIGFVEEKFGYVIMLDKWGWMLGIGFYIDDIFKEVLVIWVDFVCSIC